MDAAAAVGEAHPLARTKDTNSPKTKRELLLAARFRALAAEHGMGIVQLANRFILSHAGVSTVLGGFSSAQQVEDTVTSAADVDSLSENLLMDIRQIWDRL